MSLQDSWKRFRHIHPTTHASPSASRVQGILIWSTLIDLQMEGCRRLRIRCSQRSSELVME